MWMHRIKRLHFVGIGGAGMSGIAEILHANGFTVGGSDLAESEVTEHLCELGIAVTIGHDPRNITDADVIVISSAVTPDNPELLAARDAGCPVIRRAEMLGELMRLKFSIGIAGTHGKTTTTSMIGHILTQAGMDPTVIVGGRLVHLESNAQLGKSQYLVAEADEYDRSFLSLHPTIAIATNLEEDHLDCFDDLADLQDNFAAYFQRVPFYGAALTNAASPGLGPVAERINRRHRTFAIDAPADVVGDNLRVAPKSSEFEVLVDGEIIGAITVPLPGRYNAENALAACAVALELDVAFETITRALGAFHTVARRFEIKGTAGDITVIDDYAHHPTEVRFVLAAARDWIEARGRVIAIFQPHLFSRTRQFAKEFADALALADGVILAPIYPAREAPIPGVTSALISQRGSWDHLVLGCRIAETLEQLPNMVSEMAQPGDCVLTIGAGTIYRSGPQILKHLTNNEVRV